jgi:hypothetical protein
MQADVNRLDLNHQSALHKASMKGHKGNKLRREQD